MNPANSRRPSSIRSAAPALIGAAIGGIAILLAVRLFGARLPEFDLAGPQKAVLVLGAIVVLLGVLAAHEAGHLLGGRLAGFRPLLFVVGPLKLERRGDGWHAGLNRSVALYGGVAASAPSDTANLRWRMLRVVAGGPVLSLLLGIVVLTLLTLAPVASARPGASPSEIYAATWLLLLGAGSLLIGVVTLIPARTGGFPTDGAWVIKLIRGGGAVESEVALLALVGLSLGGRRPREWDQTLVHQALGTDITTAMGVAARQLAYVHALDRGDTDQARGYLQQALAHGDGLPPVARVPLCLQAAYFTAVHERDAVRAREWLTQATGGALVSRHERLLAEAAVSYAEGKRDDAIALLEQAERELPKALDAGAARAEAEWIAELRDAAVRSPRAAAGS